MWRLYALELKIAMVFHQSITNGYPRLMKNHMDCLRLAFMLRVLLLRYGVCKQF